MNYLTTYGTRTTPQSEPIPGSTQVENSAGGYSWQVDDWSRLERFLILGTEGGSYYAGERKLTVENAEAVRRCIATDGKRAVDTIVAISVDGRAPKNDPAIFALAMAAGLGDPETRKHALASLSQVCRIGTHLFHFATYVEQFRGWGRGLRRAVAEWYQREDLDGLAYQLVKYRQRDGWTHRDLLRLAHPEPPTEQHAEAFAWATHGTYFETLPSPIVAYQAAQQATGPEQIASLIETFGDKLPREAIPPEHLSRNVWAALLDVGMPMTAMIRNLATMTRLDLVTPTSDATRTVLAQLGDTERLRKARVHPIAVLAALITYASGHSARGDSTWAPVPQIVDALDAAFYEAFGNVESTGKRHMLALDVSGSMSFTEIATIPGLTPRVGAAAMALVTAATEPAYEAVVFSNTLSSFPLSSRQRLDDVVRLTSSLPFSGTDCALPMLYATQQNREVDVFVVYTDSETWAGGVHPAQALTAYREKTGIDAKLIVVGMVSNGFSIADPNDAGMLDVVGFDTSTPAAMSTFVGAA